MQLQPKRYGNELGGAPIELPEPSVTQAAVNHPDKAGTLPKGTNCQVVSVAYSELKFNECILAGPEGKRRVRRVLRAKGGALYLTGGVKRVEKEQGPVFRINSADFYGIELDFELPPSFDILKGWVGSFFTK